MPDQDNPIQPDSEDVAVEWVPHSVEDMGISNEEKINQLLATAVTVRKELHDRARKIIVGLAAAGVFVTIAIGAAAGVLWGLRDQASKLAVIARDNKINGEIARDNSEAIIAATGEEARARSAAVLSMAINEIRKSVDCVALYVNGERPDACAEVAARMDSIRGGADPFTR